MMEFERLATPIIPASLTTAALIKDCLLANHFTPFTDSVDEIFATICVCASVSHRSTSYSRLLYQLSYRGTLLLVKQGNCSTTRLNG
jgi:hypothetical protein